ncbi:acyl-CoA dehydrogenase [Tomitella fengzijianii]|uniref:Acyl-CoA dehydrogenase n=1 Tax=Tomitella fengzijianii TaxID=2597660 RepID=A0A516X5A3_9ACTN|nr:acyl-CoA dehydrogenase [Tomitella fengzijianii]QDQ98239.1 acyl-CoA dehydrogenase [Tomitella fengzijianii]
MTIATTAEQQAVQDSIGAWARSASPLETVRRSEDDPRSWRGLYPAMADLGVLSVALPEELDGAGGTVADLAAMLESAAAALAPGPVLTGALAGLVLAQAGGAAADELAPALAAGERTCGLAVEPAGAAGSGTPDGGLSLTGDAGLVYGYDEDGLILVRLAGGDDADGETWVLLDAGAEGVRADPQQAADFSVPMATVHCDAVAVPAGRVLTGLRAGLVHDLFATLAAAEAAGLAGWLLDTAVEYAKIREQFGQPIGRFQAVKHLCAEMLCRAEQARAVAWDAAVAVDESVDEGAAGGELHIAASVAAAAALDCAVDNAKDCIQMLGGIGFTWEHDAHLYFRRALALRQVLGGSAAWRRRVAELTLGGARRTLRLQLDEATEAGRAEVRAEAEKIAQLDEGRQRAELAASGLLTPHWPKPYGRAASAGAQVLIDEELDRAGIHRPDLVIGAWAAPTIIAHGTQKQIDRFVPATLRGEISWCQLFSEPGAGSDLAALRTTAERVDGGWKLDGQKVWTSLAVQSDWAICLARTDKDAPKHKGITYFLVDMKSAGIRISPLREITGDALFNEVFLEGVVVPDECVVGEVDGGWRLARTTLANERVAMGGGSAMGDEMEGLISEIHGAAGGLGDTELDTLGAQVAEGTTGSLLGLRTAIRALEGQDPGPGSSVRKIIGVRHRQALADAALEIAGVRGAVWGPQIKKVLHHRCLSIAGGTEQILLTVAAERLLGLPRG